MMVVRFYVGEMKMAIWRDASIRSNMPDVVSIMTNNGVDILFIRYERGTIRKTKISSFFINSYAIINRWTIFLFIRTMNCSSSVIRSRTCRLKVYIEIFNICHQTLCFVKCFLSAKVILISYRRNVHSMIFRAYN